MLRTGLRDIPLAGVYVLLDSQAARGRDLGTVLVQAAEAGARLFQYRDKHASMREAYAMACSLRDLAHAHRALLLINDRCDLALAADADGVHLGQHDLPVETARRLLGPDRLIGLSTHGASEVTEGDSSGADYLGFGPIFPTGTKAAHEPVVGVQGLKAIRPLTRLPVFAIGGVTCDHVAALRRAGADGVAVASTIVTAADVHAAVLCLVERFAEGVVPTAE